MRERRRRRGTRPIKGELFNAVQQAIVERLKLAPGNVGSTQLMRVVTSVIPPGSARVKESHVASLVRRINRGGLTPPIKTTKGTGGGYERRLKQGRLGGPFNNL